MTLDELMTALTERLAGCACEIHWCDRFDGSQEATCWVGGKLFATWESDLITIPPLDGVTPRGPKRYHSLRFFDQPVGAN